MIHIYTDGASRGNPGRGGWAAIILEATTVTTIGGAEARTTNNRMELLAATEALRAIPADVAATIHTDSQYLINGVTKWIKGWKKNGWQTRDGHAVEHQALWQELDALAGKRAAWIWVRGHDGDDYNEEADTLATRYADGATPQRTTRPREAALRAAPLQARLPAERAALEQHTQSQRAPSQPASGDAPASGYPRYLSLIGSGLERHATWAACEARVKGVSGARFKKVKSASEERATLAAWDVAS